MCCCLVAKSCSTFCDPWIVTCQAPLCPWNSPGKNTGVSFHFLLQGFFLTQGLNLYLLHWEEDSLTLNHQGSPNSIKTLKIVHVKKKKNLEKKNFHFGKYLLKQPNYRTDAGVALLLTTLGHLPLTVFSAFNLKEHSSNPKIPGAWDRIGNCGNFLCVCGDPGEMGAYHNTSEIMPRKESARHI